MLLWVSLCAMLCCAAGLRVPLLGNYSDAFFWFTTVSVGGTTFTAIIDTGSSDFLLNQNGPDCPGCYNISNNALPCGPPLHCLTCQPACNFSVTYGGSLTENATAVKDRVSFGEGWSANGVVFGATYNVQQQLRRRQLSDGHGRRQSAANYPQGLIGLAFAAENSLGVPPLLDALKAANPKSRNVLGLCVLPVGGQMALGEVPMSWGTKPWQYVPVTKPAFWQIHFETVLMDGLSLGPTSIFNTPGIVDSGTPFVTLPAPAFATFKSLVLAECGRRPRLGACGVASNSTLFDGVCFTMSPQQVARWPELTMVLAGGVLLPIKPSWYLMPMYNCQPGQLGMGVVSDASFTIISGNLLQHYATVFDKDKMQVGFTPSNGRCE